MAEIELTLTRIASGRIRLDGTKTLRDVYLDGAPVVMRLKHRPTFGSRQAAIIYARQAFPGSRLVVTGSTRPENAGNVDVLIYDRV